MLSVLLSLAVFRVSFETFQSRSKGMLEVANTFAV
jgi:hypothetical protein